MNISLVPVGGIAGVLPALLPHLQTSAQWTRGRATIDDILQMVLSGKANIRQSSISEILNGKKTPSLPTVAKLLKALKKIPGKTCKVS